MEKATNAQTPTTSGNTAFEKVEGKQTLKLPTGLEAQAGLQTFFGRISPDASPGWNTLTISGLPAGTRAISSWMTEWSLPNNPHAGGAWYTTTSVQLFNNGTQCRVRFNLDWGSHLPSACQVIFGP